MSDSNQKYFVYGNCSNGNAFMPKSVIIIKGFVEKDEAKEFAVTLTKEHSRDFMVLELKSISKVSAILEDV